MKNRGSRGLATRMLLASAALGGVLATVLVFLLVGLEKQREADRAVRRTERATAAAVQLRTAVLDLETGMRGYIITRQPRFLEPWRRARATLPEQTRHLEQSVADDRLQGARAAQIVREVTSYVAEYSAPLVQAVAHHRPQVTSTIALGEGRRRVDSLRARFSEFIATEDANAAARRTEATSSAHRAVAIVVVGLAGSLVLVALYLLYMTRAIIRPVRRVASAARGLAEGDLTARVPRGEGGSEPAELGRAFNAMAVSLEESRDRLQTQNSELAEQRGELVAAVERLAAEKARVERFLRFGRRVAAETERDALCATMLDELTELAQADAGCVYAAGSTAPDPLSLVAARGEGMDDLPVVLDDAERPAARAALERRVVRHRDERFGDELHVPLVQADRTLGVISLARVGTASFAPAAAEAVEDLAGQAAVTLASAVALGRARTQASVIRAVLDATPDAIALLDAQGNTIVDNPPNREVRAALAESARQPNGGFHTNAQIESTRTETEARDEIRLLGSDRIFARYAAPVHDGTGNLIGRLVVAREVTGEREAERAKDEFFALVSHELRTPLTSIVGYLELVLDDDPQALHPEHRSHLGVVDRNARRLLRLVGDLLFVAQVEAGKLTLDAGLFDLGRLAQESVEAARPRADEGRIALEADIEPVPTCPGDPDRIGQVLDNLVTNALKFTPGGGRVTVSLRTHGDSAVVEVADTGLGIAPAEQDLLFDRFFRSESATTSAVPGVGLGLTIVKAIVEAHSGAVSLESEEKVGTTFRVTLPLGPWAPPGAQTARAAQPESGVGSSAASASRGR